MLYEIKPLVWKHHRPVGSLDYWSASSRIYDYRVARLRPYGGIGADRFQCIVSYGRIAELVTDCTSFDDGKAKCEAHYRERVLECLVEVQQGHEEQANAG